MSHLKGVALFATCFVILLGLGLLTSFQSYRYLNGTVDSPPDRIIQAKFPVAFCVLAKDEKDLSEWIQYHSQLGVSKFYIMDEYSNPPLSESIADFIQSGLAEYKLYSFFWNKFWHSLGFQTKNHLRTAFDECLKLHGHKHRWMGFLDADEFVILKNVMQQSLPKFLSDYDQYGGIVLNWMLFGSSGHITRPKGGVLRNYFRCIPNGTIKTIVRTDHTVGTGGNCHYFNYKESYYGVNENKKRVDGHWSSPETMDKIYINHYKIKSLEDYNNKLSRWGKSAKGDIYKANLTPTLFNEMDAMMNNDCPLPPFIANITS